MRAICFVLKEIFAVKIMLFHFAAVCFMRKEIFGAKKAAIKKRQPLAEKIFGERLEYYAAGKCYSPAEIVLINNINNRTHKQLQPNT